MYWRGLSAQEKVKYDYLDSTRTVKRRERSDLLVTLPNVKHGVLIIFYSYTSKKHYLYSTSTYKYCSVSYR